MLALAWGLLTSRLAGPIASGVAVALLVMLGVTRVELAGARHGRDALNDQINAPVTGWAARLSLCGANAATLQRSVTDQNAAVDALKRESEARVAAGAKAAQAARAVAESYRQNAATVLTAKPGADLCASADALILGAAQ